MSVLRCISRNGTRAVAKGDLGSRHYPASLSDREIERLYCGANKDKNGSDSNVEASPPLPVEMLSAIPVATATVSAEPPAFDNPSPSPTAQQRRKRNKRNRNGNRNSNGNSNNREA